LITSSIARLRPTLVLERAPDHHQQLVDLERLLQVVERPQLHRLQRALDRGVRRHHQNLRPLAFGRRGDELANELEAAQFRHHVVDDQHVDGALAEQPLRLARAGGLDHRVAGVPQRAPQRLQDFFFVVDEKDRTAMGHEASLPWVE
jgi:hypothetical protein